MPEGDTVHRQCRILHTALAGGTVTTSDLRVPRAATADLTGWTVDEVRPRGKHLLLRFTPPAGDDRPAATLHNHLMMDGIWHVDGAPLRSSDTSSAPHPGHTARILLTVTHEDGREVRAIGYDVKQVRLLPTREETRLLGHLGPDLLDPDWGQDHRERALMNLAQLPERPIGLALLDQCNLAGIGNIYRCELGFAHRIHPAAPVSQVADLGAMVDHARRLLVLNRDRPVRVTTGGMLGRDGDLWVYGRAGRPCRRCHRRIVRAELDDPDLAGVESRVIFTCPRCQPGGPAPPPDSRRGRAAPPAKWPGPGR